MGRHSRRGAAPESAPRGDSGGSGDNSGNGDNDRDTPGGRDRAASRAAVPPPAYGASARAVPRLPDGTPVHGVPRPADGTPARGVPQVRGGHPEQRETGGGWGRSGGRAGAGQGGPGPVIPRQRPGPRTGSGPRQDYLDAFEADDHVFAARPDAPGPRTASAPLVRTAVHASDPHTSVTDRPEEAGVEAGEDDEAPPAGEPTSGKGSKGRTFTGIAAAAVTTVLAIVVAGQVADRRDDSDQRNQTAADQAREVRDSDSRIGGEPSAEATPLTYEQKMGRTYALGATLKASGKFDAIPGVDKAPGKGRKYTYRVDVEQGLGLDGELFADAVQKTLNDDRSWAHNGARTFERVYSGETDFVITLASPGTTAEWCAKSGLDTTEDNVSCDSAATERVMINAYRWAQGSTTYGDRIHPYRQMLINHEVGHRLGYGHVSCDKDGELAPVMQQQTKFLDHDGVHCRANPWPFPGS